MPEVQKPLTPSQKADKLWSKLKARAADLQHGRLTVDLIVDQGHIVRAEVISRRESLVAD
jgi:hypothetical protein